MGSNYCHENLLSLFLIPKELGLDVYTCIQIHIEVVHYKTESMCTQNSKWVATS